MAAHSIITTSAQLRELVEHYSSVPEFAFDVETMGTNRADPLIAEVAWLSLACADRVDTIPMGFPNGDVEQSGYTVLKSGRDKIAKGRTMESLPKSDFSKTTTYRTFGPPPEQLDRAEVFSALAPLFASDALKIGHNVKFDLHAISKYLGSHPNGPYYDTLVASWLIDVSRRGSLDLASCFKRETGGTLIKGVGKEIEKHTFDEVAKYSLLDAEATWRVKRSLDKRYARMHPSQSRLLDLEHEIIHPVLEMESVGVRIDIDALKNIDTELRKELVRLQGDLYLLACRRFNIRSNRDKQEILFGPKPQGLGLRPFKPVRSAIDKPEEDRDIYDWSVDQETLDRYQGKAEFVDTLLEYTFRNKLHGTYVLPYLGGEPIRGRREGAGKAVPTRLRRGRIHGQFNQHGAESGRFSSSGPNLQNIPARSDYGKKLRGIFVADPGSSLIVADYSQIEPRIIASLASDSTMIRTYNDGGDVYQMVADRMGVTRPWGKELVLAISYGIGPNRISNRIGCSVAEARELMDFFNERFSSIAAHKQGVLMRARSRMYSSTIMGRRRPCPRINSDDKVEKSASERQAYNHVIQGSAADIMKIALVNVYQMIPDPMTTKMLLTVHDEIVVQAPDALVEETMAVVKQEMEAARPRSVVVPLVADVHSGKTWAEGKQ